MKQFVTREHEIEPVPGLPGRLPEGETILWQGKPVAGLVARHALKSRWIAGYFVLLALWAAASGFADGRSAGGIAFSVAVLTGLACVLIGMIELFAWGVEKTTLYTITSERIVIRFGVAISMTLNLPYRQIDTVALGSLGGKSGNIAIALKDGLRLSWLVQWPHVRGWRFARPEPSLICLADASDVAGILALAMTRHAGAHAAHARVVVSGETAQGQPAAAGAHAVAAAE